MLHIGNYSQRSVGKYGPSNERLSKLKLKTAQTSTPGNSRGSKGISHAMYYTFDPSITTVLFSLYARDERIGCSILPDVFTCGAPSGHIVDLLPYMQSLGFQIYSIGQHYARVISQVRVGSVIFLVGVGSLVCWRLWNYLNETTDDPGGDDDPPDGPVPPKIPSKRGKGTFFANLLDEEFVHDIKDFEGDDPALIQGRYFGPENSDANNCPTPSYSDYSPASNASSRIATSEPTSKFYQADNSNSVGDFACQSSGSEVEDLPLDECPLKSNGYVKKARKKLPFIANVQSSSSSSSVSPYNMPNAAYKGRCSEDVSSSVNYANRPTFEKKPAEHVRQTFEATNMEWAQLHKLPPNTRPDSLQVQNSTGRSRIEKNLREDMMKQKLKHYFANYDSDDDWLTNDGEEPENEDKIRSQPRRMSREKSLANLMEKMRQRGPLRRGSLEARKIQLFRDASVPSNLSEYLLSPAGQARLLREDSVASNMSEYAASECSEFSMDFSIKDDFFASNTLSHLVDIENELDFVKSSVFEMDEEFFRYASRPNPYMLKTTYMDNNESGDSRPESSLMDDFSVYDSRLRRDSEISVDFFEKIRPRNSSSNSAAENSMEWDSPQHGWSSVKNANMRLYRRSSSIGGMTRSQSQELQPSLEWDNSYLKKYEDEMERVGSKCRLDWQLFLPDHASLELDMEEELSKPSASYATFSRLNLLDMQKSPDGEPQSRVISPAAAAKLMTASVDSAIYSAPGSRSGSISPSSQALSQSMMSSGLGASFIELSPEREFSPSTEFPQSKRRRSINPDSERSTLAPVEETRETAEPEPKPRGKILEFYLPEDSESEEDGKKLENFVNNNVMGNKFSSKFNNSQATNKHQSTQPAKVTKFEAVGRKIDIIKYSKSEWTGDTLKAKTILKGYEEIPKQLSFQYIRKIRGDNYCGIRSVLFQMLSTSAQFPNCQQTYTKLMSRLNNGHDWIRAYSFANRLPYAAECISNGFSDCLDALDKMVLALSAVENRETVLLNRLNSDPNLDAKICEAAKLLILQTSLELYEGSVGGSDGALISAILFARETSSNPQEFLTNHLNLVGDSAGLEQIEMFLLGYTLRVTLAVVRPSCVGKDDYICFFPDSHIDEWPKVYLVAEDDRHYNVLSS